MHAQRPKATNKHADKLRIRFCSKVYKVGRCWLWQAAKNSNGYGRFGYNGKTHYAHRVSYAIFNNKGELPNLQVRHTCDTKQCVNPDHLILGTNTDNARDAMERHLLATGSSNGNSKLTESQVNAIRRSTQTVSELATEHVVNQNCIYRILNRTTWSHI